MKHVGPREAEALLATLPLDLIDVREPNEWARGHLPGARHVPLDRLRIDPKSALPRDGVMFVCARGGRSQTAATIAESLGLTDVYSLDGGTDGWASVGLPIEIPEAPPRPAASAVEEPHAPQESEVEVPALDGVIGANLRALRTQRGLSLDATARLTGVSRTQLGQIELGNLSPSVATVWKLARGFEVPFATLLSADANVSTAVLRRASARRLVSADGRFSSRALFPFGPKNHVEFYELFLAAHSREDAEAHQRGTRENLVVTSGQLEVVIGDQRHELGEGDAIVFTADVPHAYINPGSTPCWMHLVMTYAPGAP